MDINTRGLMADAKFFESYSRYLKDENRYETWAEAVERVMATHRTKYKGILTPQLSALFDEVQQAYTKRVILGSQRALQFGGEQLLKHQFRLYNCLGGHVNNVDWFGSYFYLLLCGCGVGASIQKHHVSQLPMIRPRTKQPKTHVVEDSIEGWATALDVLMSSFFIGGGKHPEYEGRRVFFDTSHIREKGAPISGGFKAPGPEPLQRCLAKIERLLSNIAEDGILRPIHVYDIGMHTADAVLSGGVRRAATIFLFSIDDDEMMNAKVGDWFTTNPQRARSNNSAVCLRSQFSKDEFKQLIARTKEFGEPGFVFVDDLEMTFNPCVTGDTWVETTQGLEQVKTLIDVPYMAVVNGKSYPSMKGFWKTGTKEVFEIKTKRGYKTKLTDNHKVLVQRDGEKVWVEVKDLKLGDLFVLNKNDAAHDNIIDDREFDMGWLLGEIIGNGCYNPEKYSPNICFWGESAQSMAELAIDKINATLPIVYNVKLKAREFQGKYTIETERLSALCKEYISPRTKNFLIDKIPTMTKAFMRGVLCGWFDADGTVASGGKKNSRSIRLCSNNLERLNMAQMMLLTLGIASTIYENRQKGHKCLGYDALPVHELHISKDNIDLYALLINFNEPTKHEKLTSIINSRTRSVYKDKFVSEIVSIENCGVEDVYDCTVEEVHCFSANGLIVHNCVEIGFYPVLDGKHGFQACNLVEINGDKCQTEEDFYYACRMATIMGTIQAGYTDFKFVSETTKHIIEKEALLGVSLTGWLNHPDVLLDPKVMKKGAKIVRDTNKEVAALLGINQAARTTCVKPAGNASVLLGTASGVHPEHSRRYLRTVQMNKMQEVAQTLKHTNPYMVEDSVWSSDKGDYAIAFPVIAPKGSMVKKDLNALKFLEIIKSIQKNWVWEGTNKELCLHPDVRHNVSNTVHVMDHEWDDVIEYIYENREYFTAVSLLSATGSKDYHQAPYNEVFSEGELVKMYGSAAFFASGLIVDATNGFGNLWEACSVAMNPDSDNSSQELKDIRSDWIRRFHKFAANHFGGDLKKTSYCLKDITLLYKWTKIQHNYVDPKLEDKLKIAKSTDIDTLGAIACSAGGCEF